MNLIYEQSSKFDGTLDIFYKCNKYVGNLKAVILISEKNFDDQIEIFNKLSTGKNFNLDGSALNEFVKKKFLIIIFLLNFLIKFSH